MIKGKKLGGALVCTEKLVFLNHPNDEAVCTTCSH